MTEELSSDEVDKMLKKPDTLTADEVKAMLAKPEPKVKRTRKPKTDDRSLGNWFKQQHHLPSEETQCDFCPRKRLTTVLPTGKNICRFCWLDEMGKNAG